MATLTWFWVFTAIAVVLIFRLCERGRRDGIDFLALMPHLTVSKKARGRGQHPGRRTR